MRRAAALAALALAATSAPAADDARWYTQIDNDLVFHTDRWYSSGVRIARVQPTSEGRYFEIGILHEVYTPDTKSLAPIDASCFPFCCRTRWKEIKALRCHSR